MIATNTQARRVELPQQPQALEAPSLPDHLSWSQVSLMRSCPQKFAFTYLTKPPRDFIASSLQFGSAVHAGLEAYFRSRMEGLPADETCLLDAYQKAWQEQQEPGIPIRFNKAEDASTLENTARGMFSAFLQSPLANPQGQVIGIEESFRRPLCADLPEVMARVDLIYAAAGAIHLVDFKTSRSRWNPAKIAEAADQLRLYEILTGEVAGDTPVELHFGVLTKAKKPVFELCDVPPPESHVTTALHIRDTFRQLYEAMVVGNFYPNPSPQNCTTCPYRSRCPAFTHAA